jgi:hypothetical protein
MAFGLARTPPAFPLLLGGWRPSHGDLALEKNYGLGFPAGMTRQGRPSADASYARRARDEHIRGALGTVGDAGKPGRPGCLVRFPCLGAIPRDKSGHNFPTRSGLRPHEMRDLSLYA